MSPLRAGNSPTNSEFQGSSASSLQRQQPIIPIRGEPHRPRIMKMVLAAERWNARPLARFGSSPTTPMPFMLYYWSSHLPSVEDLSFALSCMKHDGMPLPQFPSEAGASALLALFYLVSASARCSRDICCCYDPVWSALSFSSLFRHVIAGAISLRCVFWALDTPGVVNPFL